MKQNFKSALISLIRYSNQNKNHGSSLYGLTFLILFLVTTSEFLLTASAQEISPASFLSLTEEQDYAFAFKLYSDSLFQLAGQQFETFVKKYPKGIKKQDAEFFRAECLFQSAQYQNAAAKYNDFIQNNPSSNYVPAAYLKVGQSLINLTKTSDAITALKIVLDKYGESKFAGESAFWIGEASLRKGDTQNALKYYTLAYENFPKNRLRDVTLYSVAWTYQKRTEYANAAEWYAKLITEFPQSSLTPGAHVRIGECFFYAKEYKHAIDALTRSRPVIQGEEELANTDYLLAEAFYKLLDFADAQKRYEKFLFDHPNNALAAEVIYNLAWSLFNQKNYSKAIEVFNKLTNRSDELGHAALYRRGTAEHLAGQNATALKTFDEVVRREPQGEWSDNALFDTGIIFFEETNASKAKEYFSRLTGEFPKSDVLPDGCKMLGDCLLIEGNFKEAQVWFNKALTSPAASFEVLVEARFQSAFCSFKLKDFKDAAAKFSEFISRYSNHPKTNDARFYQAEAEYRLGNYNRSTQLYQESAKSSGSAKKQESLYGIAWAFYKQEKFPQAIESFEQLLEVYPKGRFAFDARVRLGDAHFFQKDYKKATGMYRTIIRMYPDSASIDYAYYQMGQSYSKDGDNTEAFKAFNGLIKALPRSSLADDAQFAMGWINFQRKEYGEAIKEFNTLVKTYSQSELLPRAYYNLGDSYYNIQQYVAAEESYREVLRRFPNSMYKPDAVTGIQYCLTALGNNVETIEGKEIIVQRPLPNYDLRDFVVTGIASIDLSTSEKIMIDDSASVEQPMSTPSENILRDHETLELGVNSGRGYSQVQETKNSGFAKAGIGTYFTPQAEIQFGQSFPEYFYSLGGKYFLTKGFVPNTDQSNGSVTAIGGTTLPSTVPLLRNAALDGKAGYRSESFHFYGSPSPNFLRTFSDFQLQAGLENQTLDYFHYKAGISLENFDIRDSSIQTQETRLDLNYQISFPIASLPLQTKLQFMSATGGLVFMDVSAGVQNYWYGNILFVGSLHLYWAKGMEGQDVVRLCPQIIASSQMTQQHRLLISYEPMFIPVTLESNIFINRFLSTTSIIRHEYVTNAGELCIESNWTESMRSRVSINAKSARDLPMFSDSSRKGVWMLAYGGRTTIVTFCAEMVAKLNSNDYFASNIVRRSTNDSFLGGKIPYTPAIEAWCSEIHKFGSEISITGDVRFCGEQTTDLRGRASLSRYTVVDVSGEYTPGDYLRLTIGIKNLMDSQFETWRGYKEFPLTMQVDVQITW